MRERGTLGRIGFLLSAAFLAASSAGCGGSSNSSHCGSHGYTYVGGAVVVYGGAGWYDGSWGGGWYDPGDDGSDYGDYGYDDGTGYYDDGSSGDDGSGGSYDDGSGYYDDGSGSGGGDDGSGSYGSGDDGSGDYGSGDDGSGDYGSGDDGSGDDGSGDDGSGDDGTASKHHLKLQSGGAVTSGTGRGTSSGTSHTQTQTARANSCYAYTCTMACTVGTQTGREAKGVSASSTDDACTAAVHGLEGWAHHDLGSDVTACKQVPDGTSLGGETNDDGRTPASPSVNASSSTTGTGAAHGFRPSRLVTR